MTNGKIGVPQGSVLGPLLSNIYLHQLDTFIETGYMSDTSKQGGGAGVGYARYADDFVILCGRKAQAQGVRHAVQGFLASSLNLTLSTDKTAITHVNEGITFLGFELKRRGLPGTGLSLRIPRSGLETLQSKVGRLTGGATYDSSVEEKIATLNRVVQSWCSHYRHAENARSVFQRADPLVLEGITTWLGGKFSSPPKLRRTRLTERKKLYRIAFASGSIFRCEWWDVV